MRCRGILAFRTPSWTSLGCGVLVYRTAQRRGSGSIIHSFLANHVLNYNLTLFFSFAVHQCFPQLNHLYTPLHYYTADGCNILFVKFCSYNIYCYFLLHIITLYLQSDVLSSQMEKPNQGAGATASDLSATTPEPEKQPTSGFLAFLVSNESRNELFLLSFKNTDNTWNSVSSPTANPSIAYSKLSASSPPLALA